MELLIRGQPAVSRIMVVVEGADVVVGVEDTGVVWSLYFAGYGCVRG